MSAILYEQQAEELLRQYNKESFHIQHGKTVAGVMKWFAAKYDPGKETYWYVVGMLHDIDFEQFPQEHCVKGEEILREKNIDEGIIRSAMSHGWGLTETKHKPEHMMEKILYAIDELTGLIGAYALMRPEKNVAGMDVKSLKKKFKSKTFAAGCSRDVISNGAQILGWELEELFSLCILAMQSIEEQQ